MSHHIRILARTAVVVGLTACASNPGGEFNQGTVRAATDVPQEFSLPAPVAVTAPRTLSRCPTALVDQRTSGQLRLIRSNGGRGDYEIPAGQYGARAEELLRIDCARRTAIGLVLR